MMEILLKFTKASFFLGGKVLVASEDSDDSELSVGQSKNAESANGVGNEAKLAKAAVAAAAATVQNGTIMIPAFQHHRRNLSAFNWNRGQGYDKTLNKLVSLPTNDSQKNIPTNVGTSAGLEEKVDMHVGFQLRRSGKAINDLKSMLEDHEVEFPEISYEEYEEFEEYDSGKLETIWEEEEDEDVPAFF